MDENRATNDTPCVAYLVMTRPSYVRGTEGLSNLGHDTVCICWLCFLCKVFVQVAFNLSGMYSGVPVSNVYDMGT